MMWVAHEIKSKRIIPFLLLKTAVVHPWSFKVRQKLDEKAIRTSGPSSETEDV